jgi:hypothetical protein
MSLTLIFLIGTALILLVINRRKQLYQTVGLENRFTKWLSERSWFPNPWWSGVFLFSMNAIYFGMTFILLMLLMYVSIPYIHLIVMLGAVIVSILSWITLGRTWRGQKMDRYRMGIVGSSYYAFLFLIFLYFFLNIEPSYPGEDTMMEAVGWVIGLVVTAVACLTCFMIVTYANQFERPYGRETFPR